jgi:hypothetical protein
MSIHQHAPIPIDVSVVFGDKSLVGELVALATRLLRLEPF